MRRANSFVASGEIELMSTTILPGVRPTATPSAPKSARSTSGVSGTMRIIISAAAATALGEAHSLPPSSNALILHAAAAVQEQSVACLLQVARHWRAHDT